MDTQFRVVFADADTGKKTGQFLAYACIECGAVVIASQKHDHDEMHRFLDEAYLGEAP